MAPYVKSTLHESFVPQVFGSVFCRPVGWRIRRADSPAHSREFASSQHLTLCGLCPRKSGISGVDRSTRYQLLGLFLPLNPEEGISRFSGLGLLESSCRKWESIAKLGVLESPHLVQMHGTRRTRKFEF